ncbi:alpha/beta fold hydrolase [Nocardioides bruguierae]|uniref:alpha/beta fold hydrolase n=1 Tax=Nocardioides bruguierae TaxID=2945102 RepID=UPI0020212FE1|nr:alpha/beta hydrolase [Nocardioides bruguierae]MCL8027673.1 alpha/beta hydrolase [Nocardioides bruguierae]
MTMHRSYVDTPRGQVHLRRAGEGPRAVLLLHQTAASGVMFEAFAQRFLAAEGAEEFTLLAPDTPGFGMSFTPPEDYDLDVWAGDMVAVLDALGLDEVDVLGHHTGGAVAICLAAAHPERVRSLTMVGALGMSTEERLAWHEAVRGMEVRPGGGHLVDAWQQVGTIDGPDTTCAPSVELQHREVVDKLRAGARWHEAYLAVFRTDLVARLAATSLPTLLLCGRHDVLAPYVDGTVSARPGIQYRELAAGGYVLDQDPDQVVRPFHTFLQVVALQEAS